MHKTHSRAVLGLVFAIFSASLSPAQAAQPIFDLSEQLKTGDARLEKAVEAPDAFKASVDKELRDLNTNWLRYAPACRDPKQAAKGLIKTKAYLSKILSRLAFASNLTSRMDSEYGVCVDVEFYDNHDSLSSLYSMFHGPRFSAGIIQIPADFILQLKSEDELAFVIAHELSHYLLRFEILIAYVSGTTRNYDGIEAMGEREADRLGMRLVVNAGYNLDRALESIELMRAKDPVHPHPEEMEADKNEFLQEISDSHREYNPPSPKPYPPKSVLRELEQVLSTRTSSLSN